LLVFVSTQAVPHAVSPPAQAHAPAVQACIAPHAFMQAPQFCASVCVSTQELPQSVPAAHAHLPATQLWPAPHTLPQLPQFCAELVVSRQVPPQELCPAGHGAAHLPAWHVVPFVHAVEQLPQWALSVWRLVQALPHAVCPAEHVPETMPAAPPLALPPVLVLIIAVAPPLPPCAPVAVSSDEPTVPVHAATNAAATSTSRRARHDHPRAPALGPADLT
jgi:hypothetical protein